MKDLFEREKGILRRFFLIIFLQTSILTYIYIFDELIVNKFMIFKNSVIYFIISLLNFILIIMSCLALFYLLRRVLANVKYFKIHFPKIDGEVDELKTLRNYYESQRIWCFYILLMFSQWKKIKEIKKHINLE